MANPRVLAGGGRMTRGERSGDTRRFSDRKVPMGKILLRLWRYIGKNRLLVVLALILTLSSNTLGLLSPKLSGEAINAIDLGAGNVDFETVLRVVMQMLVCYMSSSALSYVLHVVMLKLSRTVARQMRKDVFDNLTRLPVGFFDQYQTGDIISVVTYDIDTVNQSLSNDLLQIVNSTVTVLVAFGMMLSIAPKLVLVFVFTIPATFLFTRWVTTKVRPLFRKRSAKLGQLNGFVEEMLSGQKTIHAYGREEAVQEHFDEKNKEAVDAYSKAEAFGTVSGPMIMFINNVSMALISTFGAISFLNGQVRLGDLNSFVMYSRRFSGPINEVANILSELQSAFAAAERVFRLIDAEPEPEDAADAVELEQVAGDVQAAPHMAGGGHQQQALYPVQPEAALQLGHGEQNVFDGIFRASLQQNILRRNPQLHGPCRHAVGLDRIPCQAAAHHHFGRTTGMVQAYSHRHTVFHRLQAAQHNDAIRFLSPILQPLEQKPVQYAVGKGFQSQLRYKHTLILFRRGHQSITA